ncbi:MAG: FadR family transcriptional regulator [Rubellimicrobium sp.]|nr:FadR family transcriptional regulator [Rubellimicrobium sp.]
MGDTALKYLEPREAGSRGVAVLDALAGMIERAGLQVGDRLPPEVQLAAQLGVGRSTMREALNRWEGLGIIRRRRGDGTYLSAPILTAQGAAPVMVQLEGMSILRMLEVRRTVETDVARKAAEKASRAQKAEIARLCDVLLAIIEAGGAYREADHAFHAAIAEATGNPMFGEILVRLDQMLERSVASPFQRNAFGLGSFPHHRTLSDAILAGDSEAAARAVHAILDSVEGEVRQMISNGAREEGRE